MMHKSVSRRHFLTGQIEPPDHATDLSAAVASAVVMVSPRSRDVVVAALATLPRTEIGPIDSSKIVIILEGSSRDEIGARLAQIAMMDGVIAANMVFEHSTGCWEAS